MYGLGFPACAPGLSCPALRDPTRTLKTAVSKGDSSTSAPPLADHVAHRCTGPACPAWGIHLPPEGDGFYTSPTPPCFHKNSPTNGRRITQHTFEFQGEMSRPNPHTGFKERSFKPSVLRGLVAPRAAHPESQTPPLPPVGEESDSFPRGALLRG